MKPNFVGHADLISETGKQFIADCRKVLKGTPFWLVARGRNPNRTQFSSCGRYSRRGLRQFLPLPFSTYVGLYLRAKPNWTPTSSSEMWSDIYEARGRVAAVRAIYNTYQQKVSSK